MLKKVENWYNEAAEWFKKDFSRKFTTRNEGKSIRFRRTNNR